MKKYSENCKLKNHQKTWKSKKNRAAWKQCLPPCLFTRKRPICSTLWHLYSAGVWISYKYMAFNCVMDLSKFLKYVTYGSNFIWIQIFSWTSTRNWDPLNRETVFVNSLICQPFIPRTAFFTTKLIFEIYSVPVFPIMLDKSIL